MSSRFGADDKSRFQELRTCRAADRQTRPDAKPPRLTRGKQDIDHRHAASDYGVNVKAELEIKPLYGTIDKVSEHEVLALTQAGHELTLLLTAREAAPEPPAA